MTRLEAFYKFYKHFIKYDTGIGQLLRNGLPNWIVLKDLTNKYNQPLNINDIDNWKDSELSVLNQPKSEFETTIQYNIRQNKEIIKQMKEESK